MAEMEMIVGAQRAPDGDMRILRGGNQGEGLIGQVGARYAEQASRGNFFVFRTTTAISFTVIGPTLPTVFNPFGSGCIFVLTRVTAQVGAIGTPVVSGFQYAFVANAGAQVATAGPIATGTLVAGVNTLIGGRAPRVLFFPAVVSFTVAPVLLGAVGLNLGDTGTEAPYTMVDEVDGRIALQPGTALQLAASTTTSKTFNVAFWGYEVSLPMGA